MSRNVLAFPCKRAAQQAESERRADPYDRFLQQMLSDAARSGLVLPHDLETTRRKMYAKNQSNDLIARALQRKGARSS